MELGAHFLIEDNRYMKYYAEKFGFEVVERPGNNNRLGIFNKEKEIIFETSDYELITMAKMLWRYGLSPYELK